ncbi:hypothetical protein D7X33_30125 [Butyricicoccus sp. 1XD8-22]|nr:hypothetical protein D7X33_30125 [Butyricicoccus sp. 1XD8-22]
MRDIKKEFNMLSLYNPEIKEQYLRDYHGVDESKKTVFASLKVAARSEKAMKKDLFEMTSSEIEEVFYTAKRTSENSVRAFVSNILAYVNWAIYKGYRSSNLPLFTADSISSMAHKYVCKSFSDYYTQEQLMKVYAKLINKQEVLILQCFFEGIRGQGSSELFNLKENDLYKENGKFYANLYDSEKGTERLRHEISEFLYELMLDVANLSSVYTISNKQLELVPSQYILKKTSRGNKNRVYGEKLTTSYITNKYKIYKDVFKEVFDSDNFKYRDIEDSGIMHYLHEILKNKDDNIVGFEEYKMISDRFNVGKYFHTFYNEEVVNYTAIRDRIDVEFYEDNYGEIELT